MLEAQLCYKETLSLYMFSLPFYYLAKILKHPFKTLKQYVNFTHIQLLLEKGIYLKNLL